MALFVVAVVCVILGLAFVLVQRRPRRQLPGPAPIPILGNIHQFDPKRFHLQLENWAKKYGDFYEFWIFGQRRVIVNDLECAKRVLTSRPDHFTRGAEVATLATKLGVPPGVFVFEGEVWRRHRRLMAPAFTKAAINKMHHCVDEPVGRLLKKWHNIIEESADKGYAIMDNPRVEMGRLTLDVVTYLSCGSDLNCIETLNSPDAANSEIAALPAHLSAFFQRLSEAAIPSVSNEIRNLIPALNKDYVKSRDVVLAFIRKMIQQTRQEVEDERSGKIASSGRSNLLKEMIQASIDDDYFTDDELVGEVLLIMLAGLDTTSILLAWSLFQLTQHPEYQRKIRKEVVDTIGETALPTPDQIAKLKITTNFIQETLRVRDPTPFIGAMCLEDFDFEGHHFPAKTSFFFTKRLIMGKGIPDADKFIPDRWDDPEISANLNKSWQASLPFGAGARICIGRQLALIEATEALAVLVRAFDFELDGPAPDEMMNFVMIPTSYRLRVKAAAPI